MAFTRSSYDISFVILIVSLLLSTPTVVFAGVDTETENFMNDALRSYDGGDYNSAFENWILASERGNTTAMVAIANMYLQGEGRPKNPRRAASWYKKAAVHGDSVGQVNFGDFLLRGIGIPKNIIHAYAWLKLAGDNGNNWAHDQYLKIEGRFSALDKKAAVEFYSSVKISQIN